MYELGLADRTYIIKTNAQPIPGVAGFIDWSAHVNYNVRSLVEQDVVKILTTPTHISNLITETMWLEVSIKKAAAGHAARDYRTHLVAKRLVHSAIDLDDPAGKRSKKKQAQDRLPKVPTIEILGDLQVNAQYLRHRFSRLKTLFLQELLLTLAETYDISRAFDMCKIYIKRVFQKSPPVWAPLMFPELMDKPLPRLEPFSRIEIKDGTHVRKAYTVIGRVPKSRACWVLRDGAKAIEQVSIAELLDYDEEDLCITRDIALDQFLVHSIDTVRKQAVRIQKRREGRIQAFKDLIKEG